MTEPELAQRLAQAFIAAQHRHRNRSRWGAVTTLQVPSPLIDELAASLAPVLRELIEDTVNARLGAA